MIRRTLRALIRGPLHLLNRVLDRQEEQWRQEEETAIRSTLRPAEPEPRSLLLSKMLISTADVDALLAGKRIVIPNGAGRIVAFSYLVSGTEIMKAWFDVVREAGAVADLEIMILLSEKPADVHPSMVLGPVWYFYQAFAKDDPRYNEKESVYGIAYNGVVYSRPIGVEGGSR